MSGSRVMAIRTQTQVRLLDSMVGTWLDRTDNRRQCRRKLAKNPVLEQFQNNM